MSNKSKRKLTLDSAAKAVLKSRQKVYGGPEENFARIARLWNMHLINRGIVKEQAVLSLGDVAMMMILLKVARLAETEGHQDSWTDAAGYAACGAEVSDAT